jgi:hypothetical protein
MTQPMKVITDTEARRLLSNHYANQRALARQEAPTHTCIHDITFAFCSLCMEQDPYEPIVNKTTGETEMLPKNEVVATRNGARGYENRHSNRITLDGTAWTLQREQRRAV